MAASGGSTCLDESYADECLQRALNSGSERERGAELLGSRLDAFCAGA
jgi:hypothetical protein